VRGGFVFIYLMQARAFEKRVSLLTETKTPPKIA
jgi:hypothetical protein